MTESSPNLTLGCLDGGLYLNVRGRATHRVCSTANTLVGEYLASAEGKPTVTVDLSGCDWMDSTFAGWLLTTRKRLKEAGGGELALNRCSDKCRDSLAKIRIQRLFDFIDREPPADVRTVICTSFDQPDRPTVELMLQAHRELAAISGDNAAVFTPIVRMLQRQLSERA